ATVAPDKDGNVVIDGLKGTDEQPKRWQEVEPYVWQEIGGSERLAALVENGRPVRIGYGPYPFMLFERVPWWASGGWLMPLWVAGLVALLLTVLAWPISALVRRHYKVTYALSGPDATAHRRIRWAALLEILVFVAIGTTVGMMFSSLKYMGPGIEKWIFVLR